MKQKETIKLLNLLRKTEAYRAVTKMLPSDGKVPTGLINADSKAHCSVVGSINTVAIQLAEIERFESHVFEKEQIHNWLPEEDMPFQSKIMPQQSDLYTTTSVDLIATNAPVVVYLRSQGAGEPIIPGQEQSQPSSEALARTA